MKQIHYISDYDYELVIELAERYDIHPVGYDEELEDGASIYSEDVNWIKNQYDYEIEARDFN